MKKSNEKLNAYIQRDSALLLYSNAMAGIIISLLTAGFLMFAFNSSLTNPFKNSWWLGINILLTIRLFSVIWWSKKQKEATFNSEKSLLHFVIGANATAIMWSIFLVYTTTQNSSIELTTTIIAISALAGGSATVLAAHKFTALFYPAVLLFPGAISLFFSESNPLQLLGVLGCSFATVMCLVSRKSADFTTHTLLLKNENFALIHTMEEKVKERTQTIYDLSNLDPLTQLYNRTAFIEQLGSLISTSKAPFSLLFIDLDGFKKINDSTGHQTGDEVLITTSQRLKDFATNTQLVCRWGGDEFLMVLTETNEEHAVQRSQELISILSKPCITENCGVSVGATIGIALYPEHATTENRLIQLADMAMYYQKKKARSNVKVFSPNMEQKFSNEIHLKNGLIRAIELNQLRLVFQPILFSKNLKVAAFEALIRWNFNDENIPPDEFIHIAEKYGLIHEIGAWVLNQACKHANEWVTEQKVPICVNVSVIQLQKSDFISIVEKALSSSKLPARRLHIEITESVFASDISMISSQVKQLQSMGIIVSIDDFGTGYSSLSSMQDLAVDIVKIDRSFINKINSNGGAIVSAVMHMSTALDFLVIAEGVETEKQATMLSDLGVHYFQGFYYSKPIEAESVQDYLSKSFQERAKE